MAEYREVPRTLVVLSSIEPEEEIELIPPEDLFPSFYGDEANQITLKSPEELFGKEYVESKKIKLKSPEELFKTINKSNLPEKKKLK